ncbi:uncharacterized protein LOC119396511 [Rhipicephalus sanguineus]|uniref:uncharacterized protein LOC119396511 n=1 Tax=Rhipicephalus sanguineus TaxID=34632 RepID=UPI0020C4136F|nr:uncharacterized protein LOC119396511 [Rhipicephalus sanguineus]
MLSSRTKLLLLKKKLLLLKLKEQQQQQQQRRRVWVRPAILERKERSLYYTAMRRLREGDHDAFPKLYRMTPRLFDILLSFVEDDLTRQHFVREPLEPAERLAITLSYLASGKDIKEVANAYLVGTETARKTIHDTCRAIWTRLKHRFMKVPAAEDWFQIADNFEKRCQFPNCLGAVGGRHVKIATPRHSASGYMNHKGSSSVVLVAVVDSKCKYTFVDVYAESRDQQSDVFESSDLGQALLGGSLDHPSTAVLPRSDGNMAPYVFVGDEACPLQRNLMVPFPVGEAKDERAVFNYRLNRVRRCSDNAFGLTAACWRVLLQTINLQPSNADYVIRAACILHNFLTDLNPQLEGYRDTEDSVGNVTPGCWRQSVEEANETEPHYFPLEAKHAKDGDVAGAETRNNLMAYLCSNVGEIPWQWHVPDVSKEATQAHLCEQPLLSASS